MVSLSLLSMSMTKDLSILSSHAGRCLRYDSEESPVAAKIVYRHPDSHVGNLSYNNQGMFRVRDYGAFGYLQYQQARRYINLIETLLQQFRQ